MYAGDELYETYDDYEEPAGYYQGEHEFDNGDGGATSNGRCIVEMWRKDGTQYQCGASSTSVLHPPDQFRHWCSALEAGYDCMHFEFDE